jgi:hypothetical protein
MSERSRTTQEFGSLRFEIGLFVAFIVFFSTMFVGYLFFPRIYRAFWDAVGHILYSGLDIVFSKAVFPVLLWGSVAIGCFLFIGAIVLALKRIYDFVTRRYSGEKTRDEWNEYRIK